MDVKVKVDEKVAVEVNPPKLVDVGVGVKVQLPQRVGVKLAVEVGACGLLGVVGVELLEQAWDNKPINPSPSHRLLTDIFLICSLLKMLSVRRKNLHPVIVEFCHVDIP